MIATVSCYYKYFAIADLYDLGDPDFHVKARQPVIGSDLWINIMTEEYAKNKKHPTPTKVYKNITVGNFIRQLSEGVSTEGF
jgi:hypothetical protein